jgi:hypothetical protein
VSQADPTLLGIIVVLIAVSIVWQVVSAVYQIIKFARDQVRDRFWRETDKLTLFIMLLLLFAAYAFYGHDQPRTFLHAVEDIGLQRLAELLPITILTGWVLLVASWFLCGRRRRWTCTAVLYPGGVRGRDEPAGACDIGLVGVAAPVRLKARCAMTSTLATASTSPAPVARSARAHSTLPSSRGLRLITRTVCLASRRRGTISRPSVPVPSVTNTCTIPRRVFSIYRAASLPAGSSSRAWSSPPGVPLASRKRSTAAVSK